MGGMGLWRSGGGEEAAQKMGGGIYILSVSECWCGNGCAAMAGVGVLLGGWRCLVSLAWRLGVLLRVNMGFGMVLGVPVLRCMIHMYRFVEVPKWNIVCSADDASLGAKLSINRALALFPSIVCLLSSHIVLANWSKQESI